MAYPLDVGIGKAWFGRRRRFVSGVTGDTLDLVGGYGGNSVLCIDGEWTHLSETFSNVVFYEARFAPVLLGRYWLIILGNLLLNSGW